ncbi:MAG: hypothetical protein ACK5MK_00440 [Dysgonomonas sp.]
MPIQISGFLYMIFICILVVVMTLFVSNVIAYFKEKRRYRRITLDKLESELDKLAQAEEDTLFIGIIAKGYDCLYFVKIENVLSIEYEVMMEDQLPYLEKLHKYAIEKDYKFLFTTHHNKPNYETSDEAIVLRIEPENASVAEIASIGTIIQKNIFLNENDVVFDIIT